VNENVFFFGWDLAFLLRLLEVWDLLAFSG
jgi:hypothetical protein